MVKQVKHVLIVVMAVGLHWLACGGAGAEEDYEIRLKRTLETGKPMHFRKVVAVKRERRAEMNGRALPGQVQVQAVEFHGRFTILELDERGGERKNAYEVEKFVLVEGEKQRELLKPGVKFTATAGKERTVFELGEGAEKVSDEQQRYLQMIIDMRVDEGPTMDEIYGAAERKKVGESWAVDAEKLAKAHSGRGTRVKAEDVEGTVKLLGVEEKDGVKCLRLRFEMTMAYALADAPGGAVFKGARRQSRYEGLMPVDPTSAVGMGMVEGREEVAFEQPGPEAGSVVKMRMMTNYRHVHEVREAESVEKK